jgi:hypothetical protein
MNERRNLLQKLGMAGAAALAAIGTGGVARAQQGGAQSFDRIRDELVSMIRRLNARITRLDTRVDDVEGGQFETGELQISSPDGGPSSLVLGETGECRIEVDPGGPGGLMVRDPGGMRLLPPAVGAGGPTGPGLLSPPTLLFGETDECTIAAGPDGGLMFADPCGFSFSGGETEIISNITGTGEGEAGGIAFMDSLAGVDLECRGRIAATEQGMSFDDAAAFEFKGAEIKAVTALDDTGAGPPSGVVFFDEVGIDVECRGRIAADAAGMQFSDAAGFEFTGGELKTIATTSATGAGTPGGLVFFEGVGIDLECRGRVSANVDGMLFDDAANFAFNGKVAAQEFIQTSSGQLKENVRPIDDALSKIHALQGVYFDWKAERGGGADVGFVAEAVNDVLPEVVAAGAGPDGVTGVKYANIVAVAVEGIKAQQSEIERLEADNRTMRESLDELQAQLEKLTATVARRA